MGLQLSGGIALVLFATALCFGGGPATSSDHIVPTAVVPAEVTRVIDGSTLDARLDGNRAVIGYLGVRTLAPAEACGPEALARNGELAGSLVLVEDDPTYSLDETGRRLYYAAFTVDGSSIDELLVREGLAWATRTDARYGPALAGFEQEAQAAGRGCLWGSR